MKNDSLQSWALGAEIVGGLAVVITLGIVAFELNQSTRQAELNTSALEISAYQNLIESIIGLNSLIVTDTNLARIDVQVRENPDDLTTEDIRQIDSLYINIIRHGDLAFFQYERGAINENQLRSALGILIGNLINNPIALRRWDLVIETGAINMSYVEYVEKILYRD